MAEEEAKGFWSSLLGNLERAPESNLYNFGMGLLAQPSVHKYKRSPFEAIGQAGQHASQATAENRLLREKMLETQSDREGREAMKAYIAEHPELLKDQPLLGAMLQFGGSDAMRAVAGTLADPTLGTRTQAANVDLQNALTTHGLNQGKLATEVADNNMLWENARAAEDATEYLASKPGGSSLITNDWAVKAVRGGTSLAQLFGTDPGAVLAAIPGLKNINPKDIPTMLEAAETVLKARATVAGLAESGSTNAGVMGLQNALTGQGAGAGAEVQREKFRQARARAEQIAKAAGWELPTPQEYGWRAKPEEVLPANMQPNTSTTITPDPNVPQRTPAPQVQRVKTVPIAPDGPFAGQQMQTYPREIDGRRKAKPGQYYIAPDENGVPTVWQK